jgi:transposase InsO family protein
VQELCRALEVSDSGYYRWRTRPPSRRAEEDQRLLKKIHLSHEQSRGCYGAPRVCADLRQQGERVARKRVARLMRQESLHGAMPRSRRVVTTDSNHRHRIAENLLDRQFMATRANQKWVSDITYIGTDEGWLYLATVMDLFSRRIVGWSMSQQIDQQLTLSALRMALQQRGQAIAAGTTLLHHSDRGSQYAAASYQQLLSDWGITVSMSRRGNCWDNAVIESWHRTLKVELVWSQQYRTRNEARTSVFEYIEVFYNQRRRHSSLGYISPAEFERRHALLS